MSTKIDRISKVRNHVYFDVDGFNNSKLVTYAAVFINPSASQDDFNNILENIKQAKDILAQLDPSSEEYQKILMTFAEWVFSEDNLCVYVGGTQNEDKNKKYYMSCLKLHARLKNIFPKDKGSYLLIAPLKKHHGSFKRYHYRSFEEKNAKLSPEARLSYKTIMKKSFPHIRYYSKTNDLGYFSWLARQINLAYNKFLKYVVLSPEAEPTSPYVKASINAFLTHFTSENFMSNYSLLYNEEPPRFTSCFYKRRKKQVKTKRGGKK